MKILADILMLWSRLNRPLYYLFHYESQARVDLCASLDFLQLVDFKRLLWHDYAKEVKKRQDCFCELNLLRVIIKNQGIGFLAS